MNKENMFLANNAGRARHSVRAAIWQAKRSAGSGLPALPVASAMVAVRDGGRPQGLEGSHE